MWLASAKLQGDATGDLEFAWMGQAGFVFKAGTLLVGIDLYLSDSLAEKYRNGHFPHKRMMAPPISPQQATPLAVLASTHGHTDHMDAGTIGPIYRDMEERGPLFICPRAETAKAMERGVPANRILGLDAYETFTRSSKGKNGYAITALPAAHEGLSQDSSGNHLYLGYIMDIAGYRIYHSGDCIPYPDLGKTLRTMGIDIALLPVNGRDEARSSHGVPGNFTIDEAIRLKAEAGIPLLVPHHFGLFDFNTVSVEEIARKMGDAALIVGKDCLIPEPGVVYSCRSKG